MEVAGNFHQSFHHPYLNTNHETKSSRRRKGVARKLQNLEKQNSRKSNSPSSSSKKDRCANSSPSKAGQYTFSEVNPASCLCTATHTESKVEYTCKVTDTRKFQDIVSPYYHLPFHHTINQIKETLVGEKVSYVIFKKSLSDLHNYVRSKRRLKEDEASLLFHQVVQAVTHCHRHGVVLRDLKLRKFVFKNKECTDLKLETLDSCAVLTDPCDDTLHEKHGCPAYVSPEILQSTAGYSAKAAEVWSLGVILYTMLCGKYPFHDADATKLFAKIRRGHFVIPSFISPKARCLLRAMLRLDPRERLTCDELLEHAWFRMDFEASTARGNMEFHPRGELDQMVPSVDANDAKRPAFR